MKRALASLGLLFALVAPVSAQGPRMIRRGEVLRWSASSGHGGLMKIVAVDGPLFEVEQTNERNRAAGAVRLYGAVVDGGRRVVLLNVGQWREVWDGSLFPDEIRGNLMTGASSLTFRITPAAPEAAREEGTAPFLPGRTLRWETGSGQHGTFFVTHAKGPFFTLEQKNVKNPAAGITRLEGEVKDGRVTLFNRAWKETWAGTFRHGAVVGRINDRTEFRIFE